MMLPLAMENSNHHGGGGGNGIGNSGLPIIQPNNLKNSSGLKSSDQQNINSAAAAMAAAQTAAQNAVNQQQNQSSRYKTELCRYEKKIDMIENNNVWIPHKKS